MQSLQREYVKFLDTIAKSDEKTKSQYSKLKKTDAVTMIAACLKRLGFSVKGGPGKAPSDIELSFHMAMYQWILRMARQENTSLRKFTKSIGLTDFKSITGNQERGFVYYSPPEKVERFVLSKLKTIYPDKKVQRISKLPSLYQAVMRCAYAKGMDISEYLSSIGYEYAKVQGSGRPMGSRQISEEEAIKQLQELYPDKTVKGLSEKSRPLYNAITNYAKKQDKSLQEYLAPHGFHYNFKRGRGGDHESLEKELAAAFPDKIVHSFRDHKALYERIRRVAKKERVSIRDILKQNGISYKHPFEDKEEKAKQELIKSYPDKVVRNFSKHPLYQRIARQAKTQKLSVAQYLQKLGFEYRNASRVTPAQVNAKLMQLADEEGTIKNISKYPALYENVRRICEERGVTVHDYLKNIGLEYANPKQDVESNTIDALVKLFPDRTVRALSKHRGLYARIQKQATVRELTMTEYLNTLGFQYERRSQN